MCYVTLDPSIQIKVFETKLSEYLLKVIGIFMRNSSHQELKVVVLWIRPGHVCHSHPLLRGRSPAQEGETEREGHVLHRVLATVRRRQQVGVLYIHIPS